MLHSGNSDAFAIRDIGGGCSDELAMVSAVQSLFMYL